MDARNQQQDLLQQLDQVVDRLLETLDHDSSRETLHQLNAMEEAIANLTASGTTVPASMRMLRQELEQKASHAQDNLGRMIERLQDVLERTRAIAADSRPRKSRRRPGEISKAQFREAIMDALSELNGTATRADIVQLLQERLEPDFGPEDVELTSAGRARWLSRLFKAKRQLVREGLVEEHEGDLRLTQSP